MVVVNGTWVQLEDILGPFTPVSNVIEFSATVEDWADEYNAEEVIE